MKRFAHGWAVNKHFLKNIYGTIREQTEVGYCKRVEQLVRSLRNINQNKANVDKWLFFEKL